jgi:hypothetical protein
MRTLSAFGQRRNHFAKRKKAFVDLTALFQRLPRRICVLKPFRTLPHLAPTQHLLTRKINKANFAMALL